MITTLLIAALIAIESGGNNNAQGQANEYGCLQIKPIAVEDVNRILRLRGDDRVFTLEDRGDREKSVEMLRIYLGHYVNENRIGHEPRMSDYARVWKGGPNGYLDPATLPYWEKVQRKMLDLTE